MKNEEILNCNDLVWINFMCLLRLSSVVKDHTLSYYLDVGDVNYKHSFNCITSPRIINILPKYFAILLYRNKKISTFVMPEKIQSNCFYHCYLQFWKKKNVIQVITIPLLKKIAWNYQKWERRYQKWEVWPLDLTKVTNQNWKPNLALNHSCSYHKYWSLLHQ